jgi:hypothetical protein
MAHREHREKEVDSVYSGSSLFFSVSAVRKKKMAHREHGEKE